MIAPGTQLAHYRIEALLGSGGMGQVYRAFDEKLHRRVALKVLTAGGAAATQHMVREARAAAALEHPNKVSVFELGEVDGAPFLAMELITGPTFRAFVGDPALAWQDKTAWLLDVARALDAAHAAGLVHRDVKPENVMLRDDGVVKVLDFGLARRSSALVDGSEPTAAAALSSATGGVIAGTAAYMAPEQLRGGELDGRCDQFAWGVMAFELLAGEHPWGKGREALALVSMMLTTRPRVLADLRPELPARLSEVLARALSADRADRFPTMRALVSEVAPLLGQSDRGRPVVGTHAAQRPTDDVATAPTEVQAPAPDRASARSGARSAAESDRSRAEGDALGSLASRAVAIPAHPLRGYLACHAGLLVLGSAALVAVGYAGEARRDVLEWAHLAGHSLLGTLAFFVGGCVGLVFVARRRTRTSAASLAGLWLALLPALSVASGSNVNWLVILSKMGDAHGLSAAEQFNLGMYESSAARFVGLAASALLLLSCSAIPGLSGAATDATALSGPLGLRRREALFAAVGLAVLAAVAVALGAPSGALVAGTGAAALAIGAAFPTVHAEHAARDEVERAVAGLLAVTLAVGVGSTRLDAREAVLWAESPTRADRVAEILAAQGERSASRAVLAGSMLAFLLCEVLRFARLSRSLSLGRPRRGTQVLAVVVVLGASADLLLHGRFLAKRDELRAESPASLHCSPTSTRRRAARSIRRRSRPTAPRRSRSAARPWPSTARASRASRPSSRPKGSPTSPQSSTAPWRKPWPTSASRARSSSPCRPTARCSGAPWLACSR